MCCHKKRNQPKTVFHSESAYRQSTTDASDRGAGLQTEVLNLGLALMAPQSTKGSAAIELRAPPPAKAATSIPWAGFAAKNSCQTIATGPARAFPIEAKAIGFEGDVAQAHSLGIKTIPSPIAPRWRHRSFRAMNNCR